MVIMRMVMMAMSTTCHIPVGQLSFVFGLLGATLATFLCFILPVNSARVHAHSHRHLDPPSFTYTLTHPLTHSLTHSPPRRYFICWPHVMSDGRHAVVHAVAAATPPG